MEEYQVDDIIFERFIDYLINGGISLDFYGNEQLIKTFLKANIAEQLYSPNLGAQIKASQDSMLKRVLDLDREVTNNLEEALIRAYD